MIKEIGGYLELENYENGYNYYPNYYSFNCARNAFLYFCKCKGIKKVYVPYFLCDSIISVCFQNNIKYEYYKINKNLLPIFNKEIHAGELLYIVNYFGQITNNEILYFNKIYKNILIDNVQSFYRKSLKGIPSIYSCRKFFGVPDGGYLSNIKLNYNISKQSSASDRMIHLIGRMNGSASEFYKYFLMNEKKINSFSVEKMSIEAERIMNTINHNYIVKVRNNNFAYLFKNLKSLNCLKIRYVNGAFCYPLLIDSGEKLRKILISNLIYVPKFWPNVTSENGFDFEFELSKNLLPLPCDQRYTIDDMKRICDIIHSYAK